MLQGSMVAIVTPFADGKIDERSLRKLIDRQIEGGTGVIVPCGTTGESATLTHEEHDRVIEITVDCAGKRAKVLAGAGSNATHEAVRLNKKAEKAGAHATLHITPYYNKPTQEGLFQHFRAIAESSPISIILYNVPGRTGVNMLPETVARLAEIKNIVGIKEASGLLEQVAQVIKLCPKNFTVLSGEDAQNLEIFKLGGKGAISVTANVAPKECARVWDFFRKGGVSEADEAQKNLMPLHKVMFVESNPIPVKAALAMMGLIREEYRLPLVSPSVENREKIRKVLKEFQLVD